VLRYWLAHAGLSENSVEIIGMGEDKVQQALLTRSVDGASILEPIVTIVQQQLADAKIVVSGGEMFHDQPGAVVAVRESTLKDKRAAIEKLVALHIRATELLKSDPTRAANDVYKFIGQGLVPPDTFERAVRSPISKFVSDPRQIVTATKEVQDFSMRIGVQDKAVALDDLFDSSVYEQAARQK
jgi:NitT/TauT family transport system substrate-binding protein